VTTASDVVYVSHEHSEQLGADTTYIISANHTLDKLLKIYSINTGTGAYQAGATIGDSTATIAVVFNSTHGGLELNGLQIKIDGPGANKNISFQTATTGISLYVLNDCLLEPNDANGCSISLASTSVGRIVRAVFNNCTINIRAAGATIAFSNAEVEFNNCAISSGSVAVDNLFSANSGRLQVTATGCDFGLAASIASVDASDSLLKVFATQCKLASGAALISTTGVFSGTQVELRDCASGDSHIQYAYADNTGELSIDTAIYANDNISNDLSWKITTTENASRYNPFVTPWISVYHDGTSAITPYLEILRSGSSTAFTDAEVWAEWSYKGTSGSTRATIDNDGAAILATPANQTTSEKIASEWTGEDATSWFGKIGPASAITPAEVGDLAFRICVGAPSATVYVDPQIRGLS
jgi:hypothetical protein